MDKYLTVMVTVLVATQIIRITQNTISLIRQNKAIQKDLEWIKDNDISERDFDCQREVFYLLREKLREERDEQIDRPDRT